MATDHRGNVENTSRRQVFSTFLERSVQNADCRPGTKWRQTRKTAFFCIRNEITFDFISYLLSRNNLTMSSPINNIITLSFFRHVILPHGSVLIYF